MPTDIRSINERISELVLPQLEVASDSIESTDCLVTCAGFEVRALSYLESSVHSGSKGFQVFGISYSPVMEENNLLLLRGLCNSANAQLHEFEYERQNPQIPNQLMSGVEGAARILLDISGMSRLLIVQLVSELLRRGLASRSHVLYTEALSYPPSKEEVVTRLDAQSDVLGILNFISSGVFGIQVVPELSTVAMQGQPIRMVVFPSFNPSQLAAVCSEIPAAAVTIVNGVPPKDSNRWRTDAIRSLNNVESIAGRDEVNTSTFDYRETLQLLLRIYQEHGTDEKIVISPTGSKMQSVAVGIICGLMSDIQIVYPTPRMFPSPTNYTEGAGQSYQLPLGVFAGV